MSYPAIDLLIASSPEAPSIARRSLGELQEFVSAEQLQHARLLVTELVTNSVLHASPGPEDSIRLEVGVSSEALRAEVTDSGPGFKAPSFERTPGESVPSAPSPKEEGGRGLYLLERLSRRWGVCQGEFTCVWFEILLV